MGEDRQDGSSLAGAPTEDVPAASETDAVAPTASTVILPGASDDVAPIALGPGARVGRYAIVDEIGRGGMGVVYRAYDPELDRGVALKVLGKARKARSGKSRLLREAQALARLDHPNVVSVFDVGTVGGHVFVAMQLVAGQTLRKWLREAQHTPDEILGVFLEAGRGLAAAHRAGLIHRDFKPGNVLIDEAGHARVLDFGLARAFGGETSGERAAAPEVGERPASGESWPTPGGAHGEVASAETPVSGTSSLLDAPLTHHGAILGTPPYMAPEQHLGERAGPAADQYAFCVALFEALLGRHPFSSAREVDELRAAVFRGTIRWPDGADRLPRRVREALSRGLATDPDERFPSIEALLAVLTGDGGRRRRRVLGGLAGGVGVAAIALGVVFGRGADSAGDRCQRGAGAVEEAWNPGARDAIARAFAGRGGAAGAAAERVTVALDEYATRWRSGYRAACEAHFGRGAESAAMLDARMQCLRSAQQALATTAEGLAQDVDDALVDQALRAVLSLPALDRCADAETLGATVPLPADPDQRRRIETLDRELARAQALENLGRFDAGLDVARAILRGADELDFEPLRAAALLRVGALQIARDELDDGEEILWRAAESASRAGARRTLGSALTSLVFVIGNLQQRTDEAVRLGQLARGVLDEVGDREALADLATNLGVVHERRAEYGAARKLHEEALAAYLALGAREAGVPAAELTDEALTGASAAHAASVLNNLGNVTMADGELPAARDYLQRSLALRERVLDPGNPRIATSMNNLSIALRKLGEYQQALEVIDRAIAHSEQYHPDDRRSLAFALNSRGQILSRLGRRDEARRSYERTLALLGEVVRPDHPMMATPRINLGVIAVATGDLEGAGAHFERAIGLLSAAFGPDHAELAVPLVGLGEVHLKSGRTDEAIAHFQRAVSLRQENGKDTARAAEPLKLLGRAYLTAGRAREARPVLERALALYEQRDFDPVIVAETRFLLGQALWPTEPGRGRALVDQARASIAGLDADNARRQREQIDDWLATHR